MKLELDKDVINLTTTQSLELHNWPLRMLGDMIKKIDDDTPHSESTKVLTELLRGLYSRMTADLCETTQVSYEINHQPVGKVNAWMQTVACSYPEHSQKGFLVRLFMAEKELDLAPEREECSPPSVIRKNLNVLLEQGTPYCDLLYQPHYAQFVHEILALYEQPKSPLRGYRFSFGLKKSTKASPAVLDFSMASRGGSVVMLVQSLNPQYIVNQDFEAKKSLRQMGLARDLEVVLH